MSASVIALIILGCVFGAAMLGMLTRLVLPAMERQRSGSIVNISSFAVVEPDAAFPTSSVFRAGLVGYTKLFADKFAAQNIRMNNVLPGFSR